MSGKKGKLALPWGQKTCRCPKHKVTLRDPGDGKCVCWKCEQEAVARLAQSHATQITQGKSEESKATHVDEEEEVLY